MTEVSIAMQINPRTGAPIRQVEVLVIHVHTNDVQVRALNGPLRGAVYTVPRDAVRIDARECLITSPYGKLNG